MRLIPRIAAQWIQTRSVNTRAFAARRWHTFWCGASPDRAVLQRRRRWMIATKLRGVALRRMRHARRPRAVLCAAYIACSCVPIEAQEDEAEEGTRSEVGCAELEIPSHGKRVVCDGHNLSVAMALAEGAPGGEEVEDVMGQAESLEMYQYKPGFLRAQCGKSKDQLPGKTQPAGSEWLKAPALQLVDAEDPARDVLACERWIEEPVVVVSRVEYANFYHAMTDLVGAWSAAVIAGVDPRKVRILFADGHPRSPFDEAWGRVFSGGSMRAPLRKRDLVEERVCLRRVVFALYGYASPMTIDWFKHNECGASAWLAAFSRQVLRAYGLQEPTRQPFVGGAEPGANLTLILREDYVAHPRDKGGGKRHNKIYNPDELLGVMEAAAGVDIAHTVRMALIPFEEQLRLIRRTHVLIGMHGAGMTFLPFLADDAVVVELVSKGGQNKWHFQNLAQWSGKGNLLWRNSIASNEIDPMNTKVDANEFRGLIDKALADLRARA